MKQNTKWKRYNVETVQHKSKNAQHGKEWKMKQ